MSIERLYSTNSATKMVGIQDIRSQLARVKRYGPGLVGVFVGGTSGIGESTAREFVRYTTSPRIYLVGRSQEAANALQTEFASINPQASVNFIQSDVSLLRNVDTVCKEIAAKEEKVNLLFLSAGILTVKGRDETEEGLDKKFSLHYYSRMRYAANLMPLLKKAGSTKNEGAEEPLARVVSVLAAGLEGPIIKDDLSLKTHFSLRNCANQATTFTSLALHALSTQNSEVGFIHSAPGGVVTGLSRGLGKWGKMAVDNTAWLWKAWATPVLDSGERHLWAATNENFQTGYTGVGMGSDVKTSELCKKLETDGTEKLVWEHTEDVLRKVCEGGGKFEG